MEQKEEKKEERQGRPERTERRGFGDRRQQRRPQEKRDREEEQWFPITKLGRLVKGGHITTIEEIYKFALPIKESQIVDFLFLKGKTPEGKPASMLKDEVMKIAPVQKQTAAGQRTRFKAVVVTGDENGHIGVGVKLAKEVQFAIKGALMDAKINLVPVRRGYWGSRLGQPHTVALKVNGKCGSVSVRLIPAPRGTGIVGSPTIKKILQLAGVMDCYTSSSGKTKTIENFIKACYNALKKSYKYLTPNLWKDLPIPEHPYSKFADKADELKKTYQDQKNEAEARAHAQ